MSAITTRLFLSEGSSCVPADTFTAGGNDYNFPFTIDILILPVVSLGFL
jgi:hypothetical protein